MKYCFILGTRPEIIKLYSCIKYCEENYLDYFLIHTNQHYSENMDKAFFDDLGLKDAKYHLGINNSTHAHMTGAMLPLIEDILVEQMPDVVFVQGDTNTVLAGALVASKITIPVAHVEAGLRSYDRGMPEEINRVLTDHISKFLFAPCQKQVEILSGEGISQEKVFLVGNTVVDAIYYISEKYSQKSYGKTLLKYRLDIESYILLTIHRPSNVDTKEELQTLLEGVNEVSLKSHKTIIFPIHPRTQKNIDKFKLTHLLKDIQVIEPVGFIENIVLMKNAFMIVTDSGGIQEEACILKKKTLVLRDNTERPETLEVGGAVLVGNKKEKIIQGYLELNDKEIIWYNPFGDGKSAEKIFRSIGKTEE